MAAVGHKFAQCYNELNIQCKDFECSADTVHLKHSAQSKLHNCGFYPKLYVEHLNGRVMKDFGNVVIPMFRMNMAYKLFHSEHNKIKVEPPVASKKQKKMLFLGVLGWKFMF